MQLKFGAIFLGSVLCATLYAESSCQVQTAQAYVAYKGKYLNADGSTSFLEPRILYSGSFTRIGYWAPRHQEAANGFCKLVGMRGQAYEFDSDSAFKNDIRFTVVRLNDAGAIVKADGEKYEYLKTAICK